jgi:hypothetical protein
MLTVYVVATSAAGTRCALAAAKRLASDTGGTVVLIVPRLTGFTAPFDPTTAERTETIDRYQAIAAEVGVHATVLFCVCRRPDDIVHQMLGASALLLVGGRTRVWWPTRERRLVDRLVGKGYPVVFADIRAAEAQAIA